VKSRCLCGEVSLGIFHHRVTEDAQRPGETLQFRHYGWPHLVRAVTTRNSRAKLGRIAAANLSLYHSIIRPILFSLSPESAHEFALKTLNNSAIRACFKQRKRFPEFGAIKRFGLEFTNPVGLAAGFDKNGTAGPQ